MAEQLSPTEAQPPQPKATRGYYFAKLIGILILLVLLVAIIILGVISKFGWRQLEQQQHELALNLKNQTALTQQVAEIQSQFSQQQQVLFDLTAKIKQLNMPLSHQQVWQELQRIEFQLNLAQEYLTVGIINLPLALQLVTSAQQQLPLSSQPIITDVQASLANLQQQLLQLHSINLDYIFAQLANLMTLTEQLAIVPQPSSTKQIAPATAAANKSTAATTQWYQRQWNTLRTYLAQVIIVRHQQHSIMPLSLSQRQLLSAEMRMTLLQAQWAILQQNQSFYLHSLQHCQQLLKTYFNGQEQESAKMLPLLQSLMRVNLNPNMPSFTAVFKALAAAYQQLQKSLPSAHITLKPSSTPSKDSMISPSSPPLKLLPSKKKLEHPLNPAVEI